MECKVEKIYFFSISPFTLDRLVSLTGLVLESKVSNRLGILHHFVYRHCHSFLKMVWNTNTRLYTLWVGHGGLTRQETNIKWVKLVWWLSNCAAAQGSRIWQLCRRMKWWNGGGCLFGDGGEKRSFIWWVWCRGNSLWWSIHHNRTVDRNCGGQWTANLWGFCDAMKIFQVLCSIACKWMLIISYIYVVSVRLF